MRTFTTEIKIPDFPWKLDYSKGVMFLGSCFSENIGQKLTELKFPVDLNPFGVLYNPASIADSLIFLMNEQHFFESDLFQDQGLWNSFHHHGSFSDVDAETTLNKINHRITSSHQFLKNAGFLILTFGTAWVYLFKGNNQVVSNCHKVTADHFKRMRLDVNEIVETYRLLINELTAFNPNLKIILTVSPIRHWKDGAVENQVSKATLILAADQLCRDLGNSICAYFPSYELMMDELRDYRFYAADMIHLSDVAVDYIFEKFQSTLISKESLLFSKEVLKIQKSMHHRPFHTNTPEYKKFLEANIQKIKEIAPCYSTLSFSEELRYFENELTKLKNQAGQ
jgi:hypothetical protein